MNTNILKKFAQQTRLKLMEQISSKLEYVLNTDSPELREKSEQVIKLKEILSKSTKQEIVDRVSYTWFNRLMALRFMDVNDYQPIGTKVVTPNDGYTLPEILDEAKRGHISDDLRLDRQKIFDILDGKIPSNDSQNEAYRNLLIASCNHLSSVFPFLFERINDYTELLLPDDLTSELSVIQDFRDGMSAEDCAEVEIIGWLYQFYISEKKDEVFASKSAVKKEDIPAATQLFTPRWIVEYMVQNTVGKLWLQNKPNSKLREHMPYFIESPSVTSDDYLKLNSIEELTLLDQACGSGHILVYGFDLLYKIYEEEGYNPTEIPELIITKNLHGFEIDERASQLAGMALMMKARSYHRRFFKKEVEPNILTYQDVTFGENELINYLPELKFHKFENYKDLELMNQATSFGSLIVPRSDTEDIENALKAIKKWENNGGIFQKEVLSRIKSALKQLLPLSKKYHCIVDNPPYMGGGNMNKVLGDFVKKNYPDSKADLMTCFMEAGWNMLVPNGYVGMINFSSWMFLSSFTSFRKKMLKETTIISLLHNGRGVFGSDFGTTSFVLMKGEKSGTLGTYRKLFEKQVQVRTNDKISSLFLDEKYGYFKFDQLNFTKIPGFQIAFWMTDQVVKLFDNKLIKDFTVSGGRCKTCNDKRYVMMTWEVCSKEINKTWKLYENGGDARKWYGNVIEIVNWKDYALDFYQSKGGLTRKEFWGKVGIVWNMITYNVSFRLKSDKAEYSSGCPVLFLDDKNFNYSNLLGYMNSKVVSEFLKILNPTVNTSVGVVQSIPIINSDNKIVENLVEDQIDISKIEWDSREVSINFRKNELIRLKSQELDETYDLYHQYWKNKFFQLHKNEEELNRQFIEIYGLQQELRPDVPLEDITILKEETKIVDGELVFQTKEIMAQFISYAVGCMFGRYSLDQEGLILANQGETLEDYLKKVGKEKGQLTFVPDADNIIPVLDDEWFEDDIVNRFYAFLKASFGVQYFDKNLAFVEESLGKDIRKYFIKDFYEDHIKRYKKRPIYWMFSSPKESFNVLIYMHRYTQDSLNKILNGYLVQYREKLNTKIENLDHIIVTGSSAEQTKAQKEKDRLKLVIMELVDYEREILRPLAIDRISLDLDDGVLVNYNKFGKAIKDVAGLNDAKTKKKVREFDWINTEEIR
jgi:hypothetical protein